MPSTFRFDLAFGVGDSLCCDFYDPRRHLDADSTELPSDLTKLLKRWIAERKSQDDGSATSKAPPASSDLSDETPWDEDSDLDREKTSPEPSSEEVATSTGTSSYPRIYNLAFGSRPNESAIIFKAGKEWFIGKTAFRPDRLI